MRFQDGTEHVIDREEKQDRSDGETYRHHKSADAVPEHLDRRVDDGYRQYGYEIYKAVDPDIEESQSRHNDSGADESEDHIARDDYILAVEKQHQSVNQQYEQEHCKFSHRDSKHERGGEFDGHDEERHRA